MTSQRGSEQIMTIDSMKDVVTKQDITIVVPVLNEEQSIAHVIDSIQNEGYTKIIVIDGFSIDKTFEIARSMGVETLHQEGTGKAAAVKTAIDYIKTPYLALIDGDSTYDPADIEKLIEYTDKYDQVIVERKHGSINIPTLNRFGNKVINIIFNILFKTKLKDVCSGLYLIKLDAVKKIDINSDDFCVEVELAAKISKIGNVIDIPVNYYERIGKKKLKPFRDGMSIILTMFKIYFNLQ